MLGWFVLVAWWRCLMNSYKYESALLQCKLLGAALICLGELRGETEI